MQVKRICILLILCLMITACAFIERILEDKTPKYEVGAFTLPPELKNHIHQMEATLNFYGILVYHHGDLEKALWETTPIAQQTIDISEK